MKAQQAWVLAAALALTVPLLVIVTPTAESATTTRVLTITNASAQPQVAFRAFDGNPPKVFDFNGDGKLEIIAQNDNQWVYIFDSKTGAILAEMRTRLPSGWGARSFNGPEVAVLVDGGSPRLVVINSAAIVTMFRFDQAGSTNSNFVFHKEWDRRLSTCYSNPGSDSKPTFADLNNDGRLEIILTTEERGIYVLKDDGSPFWHKCVGGGNAEASVGDLNRDGKPDVVHVSDGGIVSALNGPTGAYLWTFNAHSRFNLRSGSMPVGAAVGQLDGLTGPDVVVGARDSHDTSNYANDHAVLIALSAGGSFLWGKRDPTGAPLTYTHPIITDAGNDGEAEVYWADWNTIGHKGGIPPEDSWQVVGPAYAYRYSKSGALVWKTQLNAFWHNKDLAIADVDADGVQEVIANGAGTTGRDGFWYLDSRTGAKERHIETYPYQVARAPIVADLWNTNTMQLVVEVGGGGGTGGPGIMVFNTQAPWSAKWPHLPYTSKSRGTDPDPTTSPSPTTTTQPGGSFGATFTVKSPNEWWQQVAVAPDTPRTLSSVQVRVNGGSWHSMTFRADWGPSGEWTSSQNTKAGSRVEFRATDTGGATSQSQPFTWMDGTFTRRSTGGGSTPSPTPTTTQPGGTFGATFTVKSPNEWWQQVAVAPDTPRTLSSVQVRVNGGSWHSMTFRADWGPSGEWTSSQNTKAGSRVEFRATDTSGATSQSQPFTWMDGTFTRRSTSGGTTSSPTTTTPTGTFTASFSPKAVGNDWWVETDVTSSSTIAAVHASIDNGAWFALEKKSWGSWAAGTSSEIRDGAQVRFRATSTAGQTATSDPVTWT